MKIAWVLLALLPAAALAEGNLSALPTDLPELVLNGDDLTMSEHEYQLETGKSYRLTITGEGNEDLSWRAPELFRNAWLDHVGSDDVTVQATGIYSIDMEGEGEVEIQFVPLRQGKFPFWVEGYQTRGMAGAFVVN